jgi:hypothetical protein
MALEIQEYEAITKLADNRINSLGVYLSAHMTNGKIYVEYINQIAVAVLVLRGAGVDIVLPDELSGWVEQFAWRIDIIKKLSELYADRCDVEECVAFLDSILNNIRPTCSRKLNTMQLAEIDFVIKKLEKIGKKLSELIDKNVELEDDDLKQKLRERVDKMLDVALAEQDILNENCESSVYFDYRKRYCREDVMSILNRSSFPSDIRSDFWYAICANSKYALLDKDWVESVNKMLAELPTGKTTEKVYYENCSIFLDWLIDDVNSAVNVRTEEPIELPENFRQGIGLLMRCNEAEFLIDEIKRIRRKLSELKNNDPNAGWIDDCLDMSKSLYQEAWALMMPMQLEDVAFSLFAAPEK